MQKWVDSGWQLAISMLMAGWIAFVVVGVGAINAQESESDSEDAQAADQEVDTIVCESLSQEFHAWAADAPDDYRGVVKTEHGEPVVQEISWMAQLLPHIGHQEIYDKIDFDERWISKKNREASVQVIPEFQNPLDGRRRWEGYPFDEVALSHFAGMAGVERKRTDVAAKYPRSHKHAGIFGYEEIMPLDDVTDGTSKTIALVGTGAMAGPWISGGGATVRGARMPLFDEFSGLGTRGAENEGVAVSMADGSARFISADVDPRVFAALCTAHAGEPLKEKHLAVLDEPVEIPEDKQVEFRKTVIKD